VSRRRRNNPLDLVTPLVVCGGLLALAWWYLKREQKAGGNAHGTGPGGGRLVNGDGSAVVEWVRPGVNGYGVGRVVVAGTWFGETYAVGDYVAIPPGVTTAQAAGN